ncbi:hypothetical protein ACS0TY_027639 [Phlomoides rotata]
MERVDVLNELKRSKRKCKGLNKELDGFETLVNGEGNLDLGYQEFLQFILDNMEIDRDNKRKRVDNTSTDEEEDYDDDEDDYDEESDPSYEKGNGSQDPSELECHRDDEDLPVRRNKLLQIRIKVEDQMTGTSSLVSKKLCKRAHSAQPSVKADTQCQRKSKTGTSSLVSKKLRKRAHSAQPSVKADTQCQRKSLGVIVIDDDDDDDDEDSYNQLCPCWHQADLPGLKEPSKSFHKSKAGRSNSPSKKLYERAPPTELGVEAKGHKQRKYKGMNEDQPLKKNKTQLQTKVGGHLSEKAGPSNSVPEKPCKRSRPALPVRKHKTLLIKIKVEDKAGTSNPVSERAPPPKAKIQQEKKVPKVIDIDDDDEDLSSPSGPCGNQADQLGPKDKGKSVVSEVPEVEILDSTLFSKQGILSPFVPSKRFYDSLLDDDVENLAFREDVLKALRKPFDLKEYNRLKEAIRPYVDHYKDLKKRLHARYKQEKRLAIFRGFFFWLQNLTREGSFQPWNDRACLEVEPAHVGDK